MKSYLKVDHNEDDNTIISIMESSNEFIEHITGRRIMSTTYKYTLDGFCNPIVMPIYPISAVSSLKYYDSANEQQTLATTVYDTDLEHIPNSIYLKYQQTWPTIAPRPSAVEINFTAGHTDMSLVPKRWLDALRLLVADRYEHRADSVEIKLDRLQTGLKFLIWSLRTGVYN